MPASVPPATLGDGDVKFPRVSNIDQRLGKSKADYQHRQIALSLRALLRNENWLDTHTVDDSAVDVIAN
jgi:hypothetical protein